MFLLALPGCNNDGPPTDQVISQETTDTQANPSDSQTSEPVTNSEQASDRNTDFGFESKAVVLNSGYKMPIIGLGTFTLDNETAENSVYHALKSGYRLIDTAKYYKNEEGVGNGVRRAIAEGIVTRADVFITTKILPSGFGDYDVAINACNEQLGLDYIDLMLIHQQGPDEKKLYRAIGKAISDGKVRSLGISNYYTREAFDRITADAEILPAVVQNENHPYYQNTELQEYVSQYGTIVESYYPLGGRGHTQDLFRDETIAELTQSYDKTSPQILLRWHIQAGYIAIPGSSNPEHIAENYDIFDFELSEEEMQKIADMNTGERYESW
jgi:diketogulonate reductase-like aldo/keto reductase